MGFMQMQENKQTRIKDILENSAKYDTLLGFDTMVLLIEMENRVVLLFVKLNNIIQMRFDDILESGAKIVFVFYGYNEADDKNYISKHGKEADYTINFSGMRNDNVRFIYYDEEDNKFTLLSGELKETGNNGDNNIYFFESSDFSAQINLVSSYLKFYMDKINFLFLSYNDVHSDNSTKGAGNITCISEECANQEVSTKQCEGEIKVSLTLTGKKETISQLKDLPVYMYIDYSKEIIDSTITLSNEETAQAEFGFKTESKSNLILKFSFYRSIYNTIKSADEIETISHTLHLCKSGSNQYDFNEKFKEKYFPDIIEITGIQLLSYNDKKLEILVLNNVKNTDKKSKDILKYIKWKFFVTDKLVDDKAVEKTAGLADNSITIYELDDKTYNNSVVSGNKLELEYTDKFLELYTTVMNKQNSRQSLVLYPYIAYSELNANKQNQEYLKHALVIRNSGVNKFTGVLSVIISEVQADENGIYVELEAQHDTKLVTPQINDVKWGYLILDKAGILFEKDKIVPMKEISKKIKVYYQEAWYDKYIYFFPYYKSIDTKIYALWHIEQPISLKFNGEKLQIIEDGNIIEEYEARSGQMENRDVAVTNTNVLTQHDNQTVSDNQTQDNNTLPLNIVNENENENLKAVHYPGYSAGNTLNIVKNEKFYYDDKATNKIPEGSYYIMANDIKTNPNISKDALNVQGSRYMHMFEHHNIDFTDEKSFNNIITTKDYIMNVTSHHNYFMTSNIIHGGIEYGDKGGIDLSEKADNFFNALNNIRDNTHKDKLYKVYGKVPIKLEVKYSKDWHDPLEIMEICIFSQGGHYKPWHNRFGSLIRDGKRNHQGVDLFAVPGTPVYACCDAKIDKCVTDVTPLSEGNGREIILAITGENAARLNKIIEDKIKYYETAGLLYSKKGEILYDTTTPFTRNNNTIYIRYSHLSTIADGITIGSIVKAGQKIGFSGTTGVKYDKNSWGTKAPHLHFEILSQHPASGLAYRINPIVLIDFKYPNFNELEKSAKLKFSNQETYRANYKFNTYFIIEGEQ